MREVVMRREVIKGVRNFMQTQIRRVTVPCRSPKIWRRCRGYESRGSCTKFNLNFCSSDSSILTTVCTIMPPLLDPNLFHRLQSEMDEENEHKRVEFLAPFC